MAFIAAYDRSVILALNIGNTHTGYGFVVRGEITSTGSAPTPTADKAFELEMVVDEALGRAGVGVDEPVEIVAASVVPAASQALRELASRRSFQLLEAGEETLPIQLAAGVTGPGDDRLVNAYAAAQLYGAPAIVVDVGTATTFDVVSADGKFLGGAIAPGPGLGLDALAARTARLPRVRLDLPPRALGTNTVEAIQSGTVLGHVGMIEFLVRAISVQMPPATPPKLILTGGLAAHGWAKAIHGVTAIDPLLTLRGLALLHRYHAAQAAVTSA
jgi:type III pantothenate kinase